MKFQQLVRTKIRKMSEAKVISLTLLLTMSIFISSSKADLDLEFSSGVSVETLPDSIYYTTYIPVVYEITVPVWTLKDLTLNNSIVCTHDSSEPDFHCPLVFHLQDSIAIFGERFSIKTSLLRSASPSPTAGSVRSYFDCNEINSHFDQLSLARVEDYLSKHENCELASELIHTRLDYSYPFNHEMKLFDALTGINHALEDLSWSSCQKFIKIAMYSSLQQSLLLSRYIESNLWSTGISSCLQDSKLSMNLIQPEALNETLAEVARRAKIKNYVLSLPETYQQLSSYYRLPLTDCTLNLEDELSGGSGSKSSEGRRGKDRFIVRILIPVRKRNTTYKQVQLNKIPFLITENGKRKLCQLKGFESREKFLMEKVEGNEGVTFLPTNSICKANELCKIPDKTYHSQIQSCVQALLLKSHLINDSCFFQCSAWNDANAPILTQLTSNKYSITGNSFTNQIFVSCYGGRAHDVIQPSLTGTLIVTLPCECHIVYGMDTFVPRAPCSEPYSLKQIYMNPNITSDISNSNTKGDILDETLDESHGFTLECNASCKGETIFIWIILACLMLSNGVLVFWVYNTIIFNKKDIPNTLVQFTCKETNAISISKDSNNVILSPNNIERPITVDDKEWFASFE